MQVATWACFLCSKQHWRSRWVPLPVCVLCSILICLPLLMELASFSPLCFLAVACTPLCSPPHQNERHMISFYIHRTPKTLTAGRFSVHLPHLSRHCWRHFRRCGLTSIRHRQDTHAGVLMLCVWCVTVMTSSAASQAIAVVFSWQGVLFSSDHEHIFHHRVIRFSSILAARRRSCTRSLSTRACFPASARFTKKEASQACGPACFRV